MRICPGDAEALNQGVRGVAHDAGPNPAASVYYAVGNAALAPEILRRRDRGGHETQTNGNPQ